MLAFEGFWAQPRLAAFLGPQTASGRGNGLAFLPVELLGQSYQS